ncbi:MAG: preprotein translocase subunit YajC [Rickettsiales bacterium]|jgi:preprotein translocase subunit YajC|nr:preprotein translocase subunit YajC [Rickettsiales bacterium]
MLIKVIILLVFILTLYLVLIRPQINKLNKHSKMLSGLKRGDTIITIGGIIGTIHDFKGEDIVIIEASKGQEIKILRKMIENIFIE